MIFKICSPKKLAEILPFFAQTTACFCKNWIHNIFLEKRQFYHQKLAKIAEISDHNIDPRKRFFEQKFHGKSKLVEYT
jgi:hypothetical protein